MVGTKHHCKLSLAQLANFRIMVLIFAQDCKLHGKLIERFCLADVFNFCCKLTTLAQSIVSFEIIWRQHNTLRHIYAGYGTCETVKRLLWRHKTKLCAEALHQIAFNGSFKYTLGVRSRKFVHYLLLMQIKKE